MKIGVIGDIHGYFYALTAAISMLEKTGVDEIVCLGDVIDGGEQNDQCIELLKNSSIKTVRGNHDEIYDCIITKENHQWLANLPQKITIDAWQFSHSSPRNRLETINDSVRAWNAFDEENFQYACVGHAHITAVFRYKTGMGIDSESCFIDGNGCIAMEQEYRYIMVNPSLAYQRSGVNKPRFSLIDTVNQQIRFYTLDMLPLL
jgi:predicted phosphodiesterase